jgi:hypothetical protein
MRRMKMWLISQRLSVHAPKVHRALLSIVSLAEIHSKLPLETTHWKEHRGDRAATVAKGAAVVVVEIAEAVGAITVIEVVVAEEAVEVVAPEGGSTERTEAEVEMAAQTVAKVSRLKEPLIVERSGPILDGRDVTLLGLFFRWFRFIHILW